MSTRHKFGREGGTRHATVPPAIIVLALLILTAIGFPPAQATDEQQTDEAPASLTAISPIFGQLVMFSQPAQFVVAFEQPTADSYIREAVLKGETVEQWSQMLTVTGAKGLAEAPQATPRGLADRLAGGFKRACPDTYAAKEIGDLKISDHDAFAAVLSCGTVKSGDEERGETALILSIKGEHDFYMIQWAERTEASSEIPAIDDATWKERLDVLHPIRLCPIVLGEKAPYPSCVNQQE